MSFVIGVFTYRCFTFNRVVSVTIERCSDTTSLVLTVPSTVTNNGTTYNVTRIVSPDDDPVVSNTNLTTFVIPDSVIAIGRMSFWRCMNLDLVIGPNVNDLGSQSLICVKSVTISDTSPFYKTVDNAILSKNGTQFISYIGNSPVASYSIPAGVTYIHNSSWFHYFNAPDYTITTLTVPASVITVDEGGFWCAPVIHIIFESSNIDFGRGALCGLTQMVSCILPSQQLVIPEILFYNSPALTQLVLPNTVTYIANGAFQLTKLTTFVIPASVTYIGGDILYGSPTTSITFMHTVALPTMSAMYSMRVGGAVLPNVTLLSRTMPGALTFAATYLGGNTTSLTLPPPPPQFIAQDFFIPDEFGVTADGTTAATFDTADTIDVSAQYDNKAEIRVEQSVLQNLFNYWTDSKDMHDSVVDGISYRITYNASSGTPLSPDFVVGAIITSSVPPMNPDNLLTNYLPHDYLRYIAKSLFNSTRGVDLFSNEQAVLESVDAKCKLAFSNRLSSLAGVVLDGENYIIANPATPSRSVGASPQSGANPSMKIVKQLLKRDPARFTDISTQQVAGETNWFKVPIMARDNLFFPITIKSPLHQQQLVIPSASTEIQDRTYLIKCVVVADGSIPVSPYPVHSDSALPDLNTFYS